MRVTRRYFLYSAAALTLGACAPKISDEQLKSLADDWSATKKTPFPTEPKAQQETFQNEVETAKDVMTLYYALNERGEIEKDANGTPLIAGLMTPYVAFFKDEAPRRYKLLFRKPTTIDQVSQAELALDETGTTPLLFERMDEAQKARASLPEWTALKKTAVLSALLEETDRLMKQTPARTSEQDYIIDREKVMERARTYLLPLRLRRLKTGILNALYPAPMA